MKQNDFKEFIIYLLGGVAGIIPVAGCYPLGVALFAAACLEYLNRVTMFIMAAGTMLLFLDTIIAAKYICIMVVTIALVSMHETISGVCSKVIGAVICAVATLVVNIAGILMMQNPEKHIFNVVVESVMIFALIIVFGKIINIFINKNDKKENRANLEPANDVKKITECAESFVSLAKSFSELPVYKDKFSDEDINYMCIEMADGYCSGCSRAKVCWDKEYYVTARDTTEIFREVAYNNNDTLTVGNLALAEKCIDYSNYIQEIIQVFEKAKLNFAWYNRMLENREAITLQFNAVAEIMQECAFNKIDITNEEWLRVKRIKRTLNSKFIQVNYIRILQKKDSFIEIHLKVLSKIKRCVTVKEIANDISKLYGRQFSSENVGRKIVSTQEVEIVLSEDTRFQVLTGVERMTKDGEQKSGDNFSFLTHLQGEYVISLSDGMGSGIKACKESETVIELIEKFLEAGFPKATALRMINSAMVLADGKGLFSTIDIASVDLYNGICEFYKIGAASTFIKRDGWVEVIQSTNLPAGIFHKLDIETTVKKIYGGEFIVLVSDGIMDSLPEDERENAMQEILLSTNSANPKEIARYVISKIMEINNSVVIDDMTVLVCGIWEK